MIQQDSNWFTNWEDQLPSPHELISLSQPLITPDLATAFDIHFPAKNAASISPHQHHHQQSSSALLVAPLQPNLSEFDSYSAELGGGGGGGVSSSGGGDESARTLKRPRLVWTPQLHKRFVDVVAHLGIKNAVPKTIMQLMSVDGLTRENVASHLQKYRLYLKRMQGFRNGGELGCGPGGVGGSGDPATDHLFSSLPVPPHLLLQGGGPGQCGGGNGGPNSEQFMSSYMALNHHQMVTGHQQIQAQYQYQRGMSHFGPGQGGGQLDHPLLSRQAQVGPHRNGIMVQNNSGYVDNLESAIVSNGRKVLTLFPTGDD